MKPCVVVVLLAIVGLTACQSEAAVGDATDTSWRRGQGAVDRGAWAVAAVHFQEYREAHPADVMGWVMEAWSRGKAGDHEAAYDLFQKALDLDPSQPSALYYMANRAWLDRDIEGALEWVQRFGSVPTYLERDYHHLKGVLLAMKGNDPQAAVSHLRTADSGDPATQVLLGLSLLRLGEETEARAALAPVCPAAADEELLPAWQACVDVDYCGELLDQRLEILRQVYFRASIATQRENIWDVARVHLRHGKCPESLESIVLEHTAKSPDTCWSWLLRGFIEEACIRRNECASFQKAQECVRSGGSLLPPRLSGPLFDPETGSPVDSSDLASTLDELVALRCAP